MSDMKDDLNNNSEYDYWKEQGEKEGSYKSEVQGDSEKQKLEKDSEYKNEEKTEVESGEYRYSSLPYRDDVYYNSNKYNNPNVNNINNNPPKASKVKKAFAFILIAIAFGAIASLTFIGVNSILYVINPDLRSYNRAYVDNGKSGEFHIEQTDVLNNNVADTDVTHVVETTMSSIVSIKGIFTETYNFFGQQYDEKKEGAGSGIIISKDEAQLLIATNNHVVEGAFPIEVTFIDGTSSEAIIKGTDSTADLAVIAVDISSLSEETKDSIKIAKVLTDKEIKVGEKVVAIGNALGIGQSVTVGYVSAIDREVSVDNKKMTLLQTDAAINHGNSGGALLNMEGEVVGINTVKFVSNHVEGMGYAIPISRAMPILDELKNREIIPESDQGYLGIVINDVTEDLAEMFNWPIGVYVSEVAENSPADKAGILNGDIITGLNEIEITSRTQLVEKVTSYRAGTEVTLRLMRKQGNTYVERYIKVTLGKR